MLFIEEWQLIYRGSQITQAGEEKDYRQVYFRQYKAELMTLGGARCCTFVPLFITAAVLWLQAGMYEEHRKSKRRLFAS